MTWPWEGDAFPGCCKELWCPGRSRVFTQTVLAAAGGAAADLCPCSLSAGVLPVSLLSYTLLTSCCFPSFLIPCLSELCVSGRQFCCQCFSKCCLGRGFPGHWDFGPAMCPDLHFQFFFMEVRLCHVYCKKIGYSAGGIMIK